MHPRSRRGQHAIGALVVVVVLCSCVTAPPPDLPAVPVHRPTILHDSVVPRADVPITTWPADNMFTVPVEVDDPSQPFQWDLFIDYNPVGNNGAPSAPTYFPETGHPSDGGVSIVCFPLPPPTGTVTCPHRIELLVARSFNSSFPHLPDKIGGDSVTWTYVPGGGPNGCPEYDAGALQDGAFFDGSLDGLPVGPGSGGDP
jgi:hypothetical protein